MSFSRLNYDPCTYEHNIRQSVGAADYYIGAPRVDCRSCFPADPSVNLGFNHPGPVSGGIGGTSCKNPSLTDVSSELFGITRKATNCPKGKYIPTGSEFCSEKNIPTDCTILPNESTRLSNPTCTLRGTGWNRWEWLCTDPQKQALVPFDFNISNRLIIKDNHRPCIQQPINQSAALPPLNQSDDVYVAPYPCSQPSQQIPSVHWRKCDSYDSKYIA